MPYIVALEFSSRHAGFVRKTIRQVKQQLERIAGVEVDNAGKDADRKAGY